jgi:hypothetical protein
MGFARQKGLYCKAKEAVLQNGTDFLKKSIPKVQEKAK